MANQTLILNVSDEMKLDDVRQELCGLECGEELCSSSLDTTEELYSSSVPDTCGDYCGTTKARYVEVLEFTHFVTMFEFDGGGHFRGNKHLITKINCSVLLDLGWGNTQEDLYTIEDRPKSGS